MKVYLSELAEDKLTKLTHYLHSEWSLKVKKEFVSKLTDKINQIASHPESCPQSSIRKVYTNALSPDKLLSTIELKVN
jgi:plasmid stabilization system protein ParE